MWLRGKNSEVLPLFAYNIDDRYFRIPMLRSWWDKIDNSTLVVLCDINMKELEQSPFKKNAIVDTVYTRPHPFVLHKVLIELTRL